MCRGRTALYSVCMLQSSGCPKSQTHSVPRATVRAPRSVQCRSAWQPLRKTTVGGCGRAEAGLRRGARGVRQCFCAQCRRCICPRTIRQVSVEFQRLDMLAGGTNHIGSRHLHPPESKFFLCNLSNHVLQSDGRTPQRVTVHMYLIY